MNFGGYTYQDKRGSFLPSDNRRAYHDHKEKSGYGCKGAYHIAFQQEDTALDNPQPRGIHG